MTVTMRIEITSPLTPGLTRATTHLTITAPPALVERLRNDG